MEEIFHESQSVEYTVVVGATPGVWSWQFRIGDTVKSGKTETRLNLMAIRRVQLRIDQALNDAARSRSRNPLTTSGSMPAGSQAAMASAGS